MFLALLNLAEDTATLAMEAQVVIGIRLEQLSFGGPAAWIEGNCSAPLATGRLISRREAPGDGEEPWCRFGLRREAVCESTSPWRYPPIISLLFRPPRRMP